MSKLARNRGRPAGHDTEVMANKLKALPVNGSFFIPGATQDTVLPLRRIAHKLGITIEAHTVSSDEIYIGVAGVRVWRR